MVSFASSIFLLCSFMLHLWWFFFKLKYLTLTWKWCVCKNLLTQSTFFFVQENFFFFLTNIDWFWFDCHFPQYFSYIVSISFIGGGDRSTWENHRPVPSHCQTLSYNQHCIEYSLPWTGFELTTLVVIGTECTCNCKSNYHTIMTTTAPINFWKC